MQLEDEAITALPVGNRPLRKKKTEKKKKKDPINNNHNA